MNKPKARKITAYKQRLAEDEKCDNTISAYIRTVNSLHNFIGAQPLSKELLPEWKKSLCDSRSPNSVNLAIAAVNSFLKFCVCVFVTRSGKSVDRSNI